MVRGRTNYVLVIGIERRHEAGRKSGSKASTLVLDRSRPLEHQHRFQMVLVVHLQFLTSEHGGHVKGKAHSVALQQQSRAFTAIGFNIAVRGADIRSEEHTSELQSLMRITYAVFCLKTKTITMT